MKPTRLILIPERASDPAPYRLFDSTGALLERGDITLETARPRPDVRDVALVPGSDVLVRWVEHAQGNAAQRRAAALWMLRDELAAPADRLVTALGPVQEDGQLVAVAAASLVEAWGDYFEALHLDPVAVVPNSLVLPRPDEPQVLLTAVAAGGVAIRGRALAAVVQPDLVETVTPGLAYTPADDLFEATLSGLALNPPLDLRGQAKHAGEPLKRWSLAAGLAAALVLSPMIVDLTQALAFQSRTAEARREVRSAAALVWSDVGQASDTELSRRMGVARAPGDLAAGAAALSAAIERVPGAELDAFGAEPGEGLNAVVTYPAFQDLDQLKSELAKAGFIADDLSTVEDEGRIVSDLRLERQP